jgi:hypothetical protein
MIECLVFIFMILKHTKELLFLKARLLNPILSFGNPYNHLIHSLSCLTNPLVMIRFFALIAYSFPLVKVFTYLLIN